MSLTDPDLQTVRAAVHDFETMKTAIVRQGKPVADEDIQHWRDTGEWPVWLRDALAAPEVVVVSAAVAESPKAETP